MPGVLRRVNEILGNHNVDKQISDNKGDVRFANPLYFSFLFLPFPNHTRQTAYLMADISDVKAGDLKEITDNLEALSCESSRQSKDFANVPTE